MQILKDIRNRMEKLSKRNDKGENNRFIYIYILRLRFIFSYYLILPFNNQFYYFTILIYLFILIY